MNTTLTMLLSRFAAAWDIFFTVKLPGFFHSGTDEWETMEERNALTVPMLPVAGAAAGFIIFLPLTLICVLGRPLAAGILGATIAPLIMELLSSGKDLRSLAVFLEKRRKGLDVEDSLTPPGKNDSAANSASYTIIVFTLYVLRMIFFGVLAYFNASFWFIVVFAGSFYIRAELCLLNIPGEFGRKSLLSVPDEMKKYHIYSALILCILAGFLRDIPFTLIGFLVAMLAAFLAKGACLESVSGINKFAVRVFGYASEFALLFTGILLYAKPGA